MTDDAEYWASKGWVYWESKVEPISVDDPMLRLRLRALFIPESPADREFRARIMHMAAEIRNLRPMDEERSLELAGAALVGIPMECVARFCLWAWEA